jgi:C_GCAxxG_C_C family probable redox protein
MTFHEEEAVRLFREGCNCSQAVFTAFSDVTGIDAKTAFMISSSFGGGMGRMREVCGAVTGAFMVLGTLYGYSEHEDKKKSEIYELVRDFSDRFRTENGSIICRELLSQAGIPKDTSNEPEKRTPEYYKKRPCPELIAYAADLTEDYIKHHSFTPSKEE